MITLPAFRYNIGLEREYRRTLLALIELMYKEVSKEVLVKYKSAEKDLKFTEDSELESVIKRLKILSKKFNLFFDKKALSIAVKMVGESKKISDNNFNKIASNIFKEGGFSLKGSIVTEETKDVIEASVYENVNLIKTIPEQFFTRVIGTVTRSMQSGGSISWLRKELKKYKGITDRRANIIALDQTRKTYQAFNLRNMEKYGIKKFKWIHSGGGAEPRKYHKEHAPIGLNGGIFELDNPPIIDKVTGEKGYPAQLINCKCVMSAVVDFD